MTQEQREIAQKTIVLLDIDEISNLTGWCASKVRELCTQDKDFPVIKVGKSYQVELTAFKEYLTKKGTNKNESI